MCSSQSLNLFINNISLMLTKYYVTLRKWVDLLLYRNYKIYPYLLELIKNTPDNRMAAATKD